MTVPVSIDFEDAYLLKVLVNGTINHIVTAGKYTSGTRLAKLENIDLNEDARFTEMQRQLIYNLQRVSAHRDY